jgi:hypothetical protein
MYIIYLGTQKQETKKNEIQQNTAKPSQIKRNETRINLK